MKDANKHDTRVKIPFKQAMGMIFPYVVNRVAEQIKAVWLIILYLIVFQTLVLGIPIATSSVISVGVVLVVFGLTFFMEGLMLGLMPLGEIIGVKLPQKSPLPVILIFALLLGIGATFAEPAIGVLKVAGSSVKAWDAPLLFLILNKHSNYLVYAVGLGVGLAVIFGMLRFLYNWSLKPFIYIIVPTLTAISIWAYFDPNMVYLTGLAWDCGGVTTGPVTVPLILALGIGISRVASSDSSNAGGFGVVTLASAFPVLAVLLLGIIFLGSVPYPMSDTEFCKTENRQEIQGLFQNQDELTGYILMNASHQAQEAFFGGEKPMLDYLSKLADNQVRLNSVFSGNQFQEWLSDQASVVQKKAVMSAEKLEKASIQPTAAAAVDYRDVLARNVKTASQAIIPLSLFLLCVLWFLLREKAPHSDEVVLGIVFAIIGMTLFNVGIELGLQRLGNQVGQKLPASFQAVSLQEQQQVFRNFDLSDVNTAIKPEGSKERFFYANLDREYQALPFIDSNYDPVKKEYRFVPVKGPLFGDENALSGILVVLLFAFIMGYAATLAEPALNALGLTVEELTVGTFKKSLLMQAVAIGVGLGIALGVTKIIWNIPLIWMLAPPYMILLLVTKLSTEDYVNIGWDSAGVTTGPITVPLVLAMGLGISGQVGVVEGFGILSMASVMPILSVLCVGLYVNRRRKQEIQESVNDSGGGYENE
ncbi:MAG: DUF1538 domain-containing protein [Syntrophomonadaceae bacterium]|nr:DUF1538 domain-containing protein [Syntrophomonadaceae bacterium]